MQAALFIVWRESIEALLIIAILYNWLKRENLQHYVKYLWLGSAFGLIISGILAVICLLAGSWYAGIGGESLFTAMMIIASFLIMHMVIWMHQNGRNIKKQIENKAKNNLYNSQGYGIMMITLLAVAREGSETVVFLTGIGAQHSGVSLIYFILTCLAGFILAIITFLMLQKFASAISWKYFFLISEFLLLMIGAALFVTAFDKLIGILSEYDIPDQIYNFIATPLWDSSFIIKDSSWLTQLTGYHAQPSALQFSALIIYWLFAIITNKLLSLRANKIQLANSV